MLSWLSFGLNPNEQNRYATSIVRLFLLKGNIRIVSDTLEENVYVNAVMQSLGQERISIY